MTMQQLAFLKIDELIIPVLMRPTKFGNQLKIRESKVRAGWFLDDESAYLKDHPEKLKALLDGKTIFC